MGNEIQEEEGNTLGSYYEECRASLEECVEKGLYVKDECSDGSCLYSMVTENAGTIPLAYSNSKVIILRGDRIVFYNENGEYSCYVNDFLLLPEMGMVGYVSSEDHGSIDSSFSSSFKLSEVVHNSSALGRAIDSGYL